MEIIEIINEENGTIGAYEERGDLAIVEFNGGHVRLTRVEALQMSAILCHWACAGELKLP